MGLRVPVIVSPKAVQDRDAVVDYLWKHHAHTAAIRFLDAIDAAVELLTESPQSGRVIATVPAGVVRKANLKGFPERGHGHGLDAHVARRASLSTDDPA